MLKPKLKQTLKSSLMYGALILSLPSVMAFDPKTALEKEKQRHQDTIAQSQREHYQQYRFRAIDNPQINNDGTVTIGQLMWMRCSLGQHWSGSTCTGNTSKHNWEEVMLLPGLMNGQGGFAGYSDWRLPSINELATLRVCSSGRAVGKAGGSFRTCTGEPNTAIDTRLFPKSQGEFWSSSPSPEYSYAALGINFGTAYVFDVDKTNNYSVRLVRTAQ